MYAIRNIIAAIITTNLGSAYQLKRNPSPATINPAENIRPLNFTTRFCSCCFSFALSRFFNSYGFLNIITIPASSIGKNKIAINSQPLKKEKEPAGKNTNRPTKIKPDKNLVIASISNLIVKRISSGLLFSRWIISSLAERYHIEDISPIPTGTDIIEKSHICQ